MVLTIYIYIERKFTANFELELIQLVRKYMQQALTKTC